MPDDKPKNASVGRYHKIVDAVKAKKIEDVKTPTGIRTAFVGDWIIKDKAGNTTVMSESHFKAQYEEMG